MTPTRINPDRVLTKRETCQRNQEKKRAVVREAKNKPCADCGGEYPPWVMDLDHVGNDKAFGIGKGLTAVGMEALLVEIDKCEVVCANCHRERHEAQRRGGDANERESVYLQ